ncbi:hypothetical protein AAE478_007225 [Parahypoxylon ruwenzoriense]
MADSQPDPDFRSIVNAAAARWYSQRSPSPDRTHSSRGGHLQPASSNPTGDNEGSATNGPATRSDTTAWQSALQSLPDDLENSLLPIHPLAQALADQPALRPIEWNIYRQQGGFKPRTAIDYSSLMIYVSGQVNPNPCRNCRLKNGPYAKCVVAPPSVLALSHLKHACANCTYQNQHRKCTNLPIDEEEMVARTRMARSSLRITNSFPRNPPGRKPKPVVENKINPRAKYKPDYGHMVRKPTAQSISAESFVDKLRQVRGWSPRSRRRMRAEVMQWQAAIMTVEAENTRSSPRDHILENQSYGTHSLPTSTPLPSQLTPSHPSRPAAASSAAFTAPLSTEGSLAEMEAEGYGEENSQEQMEYDEDESSEEHEYEGTSWVGFDDMGPVLKPPL